MTSISTSMHARKCAHVRLMLTLEETDAGLRQHRWFRKLVATSFRSQLVVRIVCALLAQNVVCGTPSDGVQTPRARSPNKFCSQASEGMWGMPGHTEAMKAVV